MTKKLLAICLAVTMIVGVMAGCGEKTTPTDAPTISGTEASKPTNAPEVVPTEAPTEEDKGITFPLAEKMSFTAYTVYASNEAGKGDLTESRAWQVALENANIEVDVTSALNSELSEKLGLLFAGGKYPDFLFKCNINATQYGVEEGILIPLEDLIKEYAPNLTAFLDEIDGWQYITSADGHIYTLPMEMELQNPYNKYWINHKWMNNLGLKEPTNYDELYTVLKAFKDEDANGNGDPNDEIPIGLSKEISPFMLLTYADYPIDINAKLGVKDGKLVYVPVEESYKEFLAYLRKLYAEEILDQKCFVQTIGQHSADAQAAEITGSFFRAAPKNTVGTYYQDFQILTPFQDGTYAKATPVQAGTFAITDVCKNPEVLIAWVDQFYTEEGAMMAMYGVEGESWEWNADGTWSYLRDEQGNLKQSQGFHGINYYPCIVPEGRYKMDYNGKEDAKHLDENLQRVGATSVVPLPNMTYTEEETKTVSTIRADVNGYVEEYLAKVVTGELSLEETWDEYLETLEDMRVNEMIDVYKAAYDRATK